MTGLQKWAVVLVLLFGAAITVLFTASGATLLKIFVVTLVLAAFGSMFAIGAWISYGHEFVEYHQREIERLRVTPFGMPVNLTPGRGETWLGPRP